MNLSANVVLDLGRSQVAVLVRTMDFSSKDGDGSSNNVFHQGRITTLAQSFETSVRHGDVDGLSELSTSLMIFLSNICILLAKAVSGR